MDDARFNEGTAAYKAGDYRAAAAAFLSCVRQGGSGQGEAYRMAGNSLARLGRWADAVTVYRHALEDGVPGCEGQVHANLGVAHYRLGEAEDALSEFRAALGDQQYLTAYKAHQGIGRIMRDRGRYEEAVAAYREAVLDDGNPDPGKALNNLGLCYMLLARPLDAVTSYKAALDMSGFKGKGRTAANLGLAYAAAGKHTKAVAAFESARDEFGVELSEEVIRTYLAEKEAAESERRADAAAGLEPTEPARAMSALSEDVPAPTLGTHPVEEAAHDEAPGEVTPPPDAFIEPVDETDTTFFTMTEAEMKRLDKETRKAERSSRRGSGRGLAKTLTIAGLLVVIAGGLFTLLWSGFGWPTQVATARGLLNAYRDGKPVETYWIAAPATDVRRAMTVVPPTYTSYSIDGLSRAARTSVVTVTVHLDKGAPLHYRLLMRREGVGWKVGGIQNDWRSTGSP